MASIVLHYQLDIDIEYEKLYRVIQYLIIEIDEKSTDAALAEVEVLAVHLLHGHCLGFVLRVGVVELEV